MVLLDVSGSMRRHLNQIAGTAHDAMKFLQPGDRVAIMVFGKRSELHQDFSDNLAEETGGEAIKSDRADASFREMVERIRSRYTLAYHPPEAKPGTFRHVVVDLTPQARKWYPAAVLHARPGYWVKE